MGNFYILLVLSIILFSVGIAIWKFGKVNILRSTFTKGVEVTEEYQKKIGQLFLLLGTVTLIAGLLSLVEGISELMWMAFYLLGFAFVVYRMNKLKKEHQNVGKGRKRRK